MLHVNGHVIFEHILQSIRYILDESYVGDWFVLYQLSKNVKSDFFRRFMKEFESQLRDNPKNLNKNLMRSIRRSRSPNSHGDLHILGVNEATTIAIPDPAILSFAAENSRKKKKTKRSWKLHLPKVKSTASFKDDSSSTSDQGQEPIVEEVTDIKDV